jgi:tetratricopeptide (TPR) repeat protein
VLRFQVPKHHRRGVSLFKKKAFAKAIQHFRKSYDFFKRNMWIDNYRYITLLSSSRVSYTEMALLNMAYCYGQIGNGNQSLKTYKKALDEFPDSEMALAALKMFESTKNVTEQTCVGDGEDHAAPNT